MIYTVLGLVILILDVAALLQVVRSDLQVGRTVLWIAVILLLPIVGIVLWFYWGRPQKR